MIQAHPGPQAEVVEVRVGIDDLHEPFAHVAFTSRQQDAPLRITKTPLEVPRVIRCWPTHHQPPDQNAAEFFTSNSPTLYSTIKPQKPYKQLDPMTPTLRVGGQGGSTLLLF